MPSGFEYDLPDKDWERVDVAKARIRNARHDDWTTPCFQSAILGRKYIGQERSVRARGERNDDVQLTSSCILEEFLCTLVSSFPIS